MAEYAPFHIKEKPFTYTYIMSKCRKKFKDDIIVQRIRLLREKHNLHEYEIAEKVLSGISRRGYCEYELGNSRIPYEHIIELSNYYDVSTDYLLGLTDIPERTYTKKKNKTS